MTDYFWKASPSALHAPRHPVCGLHPKTQKLGNVVWNKSGLFPHETLFWWIRHLRQPSVCPYFLRLYWYCNPFLLLSEACPNMITGLRTPFCVQIYTALNSPFQKQDNKIKLHQGAPLYSNIHTTLPMATSSGFQKFNFQGPPPQWTIEEKGPHCHKLQHLSRN